MHPAGPCRPADDPGRCPWPCTRCSEITVDVEESEIDAPFWLLDFANMIIAKDAEYPVVQITGSPDCFLEATKWAPSETADILLRHVNGDYLYPSLATHRVASCICDAVAESRFLIQTEIRDNGWRYSFPSDKLTSVRAAISAVQQ